MYAADWNEYPALLEQLAWQGHFCYTLKKSSQILSALNIFCQKRLHHESNSCALSCWDGSAAVITKAEPQTQPLCMAIENKGKIAFWLCCAELGVGECCLLLLCLGEPQQMNGS